MERCEIFVDRIEHALAVPLAAVYSVGRDSYVFVRSGDTVKERKVELGTSNESHVQVVDGIRDGEQVLLLQPGQGRALLEKAGVKLSESTSRPSRMPGQGKSTAKTPVRTGKNAAPQNSDGKNPAPRVGSGLSNSSSTSGGANAAPAGKS